MVSWQLRVASQRPEKRGPARQPLGTQKRSQAELPDDLCIDCSRLDLGRAQNKAREPPGASEWRDGVLITRVGKQFRNPFATHCTLCRVLSASRQAYLAQCPIADEVWDNSDEIRAYIFWKKYRLNDQVPITENHFVGQRGDVSICLNVVSSISIPRFGFDAAGLLKQGCAVIIPDGQPARGPTARRVPRNFDATVVQDWIRQCGQNHGETCSSIEPFLMRDLNLIDCETGLVEPRQEKALYVALSYVWGQPKVYDEPDANATPKRFSSLPSALPRVVSDAMAVTRSLGYRYLWVDKLCINQNNPQQKHEQIRNMDVIYAGAEVTIIAAAGEDETHGLPGVGDTMRSPQPTVRFGDCTVVSTMKNTHDTIPLSRWSTRGWTFQEALLSRRRLVFTDEQVYFECEAMNHCESVTLNLTSHSGQLFLRRRLFSMGCSADLSPIQVFSGYLTTIESYTARQLTYHEDALNALAGIAKKFAKHRYAVFQTWGIPVVPKTSDLNWQDLFIHALCWEHKHGCWDGIYSPRRRPGFPSWSWAGWASAAQFPSDKELAKPYIKSHMGPVSLEFDSGATLSLGELEEQLRQGGDSGPWATPPLHLRIEARTIDPALFSYHEKFGWWVLGYRSTLSLSEGAVSPSKFLERLYIGSDLHCVVAGSNPLYVYCLVLATKGGVSSRVGLVTVETRVDVLEKSANNRRKSWKSFLIR